MHCFKVVVAELVEKKLVQRLGKWFVERLQVAMISIAESGSVDLGPFKRSSEYAAHKAPFAESF